MGFFISPSIEYSSVGYYSFNCETQDAFARISITLKVAHSSLVSILECPETPSEVDWW
jgi:hypothetical protein